MALTRTPSRMILNATVSYLIGIWVGGSRDSVIVMLRASSAVLPLRFDHLGMGLVRIPMMVTRFVDDDDDDDDYVRRNGRKASALLGFFVGVQDSPPGAEPG